MEAPPVQYVRTIAGYDIAHAVSGAGPPFVLAGTGFSHVQLAWEYPVTRQWLPALASLFSVVQLDIHGFGMSTRGLPEDISVDAFEKDIEAVVDHLKLDRFVLYGAVYHASYFAVQYAVDHPDRVSALIISGVGRSFAFHRAPALYETLMAQDWDFFVRSLAAAGSPTSSAEEVQHRVELFKQADDQRDLVLLAQASMNAPLGPLIERLTIPTLILHPHNYSLVSIEEASRLAASVPNSRIVMLDGTTQMGDPEQGIHAIESFLAALPTPLTQPAHADHADGSRENLSSREIEVLRLLAAGKSNQQIADELVISLNTVRRHVSNVFDKTGVANRTQAATYARDHGLV